ncbi:MAG: methyltransferase domain-containing protein [Candidatus Lokiarchaeota archaeon]|nr:methyltransferase domain-containing protein [Candidatus Lokiarchaeota archaeon]
MTADDAPITFEEHARFHKPANQNDITAVERVVYAAFSKKSPEDTLHWEGIRGALRSATLRAGVSPCKAAVFWWFVNKSITNGIKRGIPLVEVEASLRKLVRRVSSKGTDMDALAASRAASNFRGIEGYLIGDRILDLGAGDGRLGKEVRERLGKDVILADVADYNSTDLPLVLFTDGGGVPMPDASVDTTILYTVLHHSGDPEQLLREAARVTKRRLVIKEAHFEGDGDKVVTAFIDWFYNRVIGDEDMSVPLNYLPVKGWERILDSCGFRVVDAKDVGCDEPLVPEHHVLIIADSERPRNHD